MCESHRNKQRQEDNCFKNDVCVLISFSTPKFHSHSPPVLPLRRNSMNSSTSFESERVSPPKRISHQSKSSSSPNLPPIVPIRYPSDNDSDEETAIYDITITSKVPEDDDSITLTPISKETPRRISQRYSINDVILNNMTNSNIFRDNTSNKISPVAVVSATSCRAHHKFIRQNSPRHVKRTKSNKTSEIIGMEIIIPRHNFHNISTSRAA
jgi:hypothetical protein